WAKEIEFQIRTADVVIPLLSQSSVTSEMLAYEIKIAHETAQYQHGKPRIMPIRVGYEGELPAALASILNPIEYALWRDDQDSEKLKVKLLESLHSPAQSKV